MTAVTHAVRPVTATLPNPTRVAAVFKRHYYGFLHSPPAIFDMLFWPVLDLIMWGLLTSFIRSQEARFAIPIAFLLGGVLLWDLLFRSNIGIATAFLDDSSWSRNAVNLLVSPLRPSEYLIGAVLWSLAKVSVGWTLMTALAFALFSFDVFTIGFPLVVLAFAVVVFGVALSVVVLGLVMRFGQGADILAWGLAMLMLPLSAVYYPLSVLPGWVQNVASALPSTHVFESMRAVLRGAPTPWGRLGVALALDAVYLAAALAYATRMFATLRKRGFVTRYM